MFQQNGYVIGKVIYAGVTNGLVAKSGNKSDKYSMMLKTPEGAVISVTTSIWESRVKGWNEKRKLAMREKIDRFLDIMANYKANDTYAHITIRPANMDGKLVQFNKFSTYKKEDGKLSLKIDLFEDFANVVETETNGDGDLLVLFKNGSKKFTDLNTNIRLSMLLKMIDSDEIVLTDNSDMGEITVNVAFDSNNSTGLPTIGQGYEITVVPVKGEAITVAKQESLDWDSEKTATQFGSESLKIVKVAKVPGYKMDDFLADSTASMF